MEPKLDVGADVVVLGQHANLDVLILPRERPPMHREVFQLHIGTKTRRHAHHNFRRAKLICRAHDGVKL